MLVDAAIVAFVGTFIWRGLRRGLILSLTGLLGFVVATFAAVFGFRVLARPLEGAGLSEGVANLIGAVLVFVAVTTGAHFIGKTLTRALRWSKLNVVNAAGGGALSGAWALAWVTVFLLGVSVIPANAVSRSVESSTIGSGIVREAPRWAVRIARSDLRRALELFIPDARPVAIAASSDLQAHPGAERVLFEAVNEERTLHDLPALAWDEDLARVARAHARDMYRNGFVDHVGSSGLDAGGRLDAAGVEFGRAGENIALAPSARTAHVQLMASEEHRRHVLDDHFTDIGIGVLFGPNGLLAVQEFVGPFVARPLGGPSPRRP